MEKSEIALKLDGSLPDSVSEYLLGRLEIMHPAYFALVMATGIVSIDCHLFGFHAFAEFLFWINLAAFSSLWIFTAARIYIFPDRYFADWTSHQRGLGFFTYVAATSVIGTQIVLIAGNSALGHLFWWIALFQWVVLTYAIFIILAVKENKPSLEEGINGGWLVSVVAIQSVCILGTIIRNQIPLSSDIADFLLISLWLAGGMLYIWLISLIFYRYMFFPFSPTDLMPPYWVNMGAMAISTLAGASLTANMGKTSLLIQLVPFIKGLTMMYWATATWWIPMLVVLGFWRHIIKGFRLNYDPLYWGLVFPLGMYSAATFKLGNMIGAAFLIWIARAFLVIALSAWLLCFLGMLESVLFVLMLWANSIKKRAVFKGNSIEEVPLPSRDGGVPANRPDGDALAGLASTLGTRLEQISK